MPVALFYIGIPETPQFLYLILKIFDNPFIKLRPCPDALSRHRVWTRRNSIKMRQPVPVSCNAYHIFKGQCNASLVMCLELGNIYDHICIEQRVRYKIFILLIIVMGIHDRTYAFASLECRIVQRILFKITLSG